MPTLNVRITERSHQTLKALADREGETMQSVLDKALETYRRKRILEQSNAAFQSLRNDPQRWQEEQDERGEWEATLADGLDRP